MKALIVDDEQPVIVSVKLLVDWKKYGIDTILETTSAADVPALIRTEKPELVISDVQMPGLSGLQLIAMIHEIHPPAQIIMISGYSKYDYMRSALQQKCIDYILKPLDEDQLNAAVGKAIETYRVEASQALIEQSYDFLHSELSKKRAQRLFLLYHTSHQTSVIWAQLCEIMPAFSSMESCRIGILPTGHLPSELFSGARDLSLIVNFIHDLCYETGQSIASEEPIDRNIHILFHSELSNIPELCRRIVDAVREEFHLFLPLGLSPAAPFPVNFSDAVRQAEDAVQTCGLMYTRQPVCFSHVTGKEAETPPVFRMEEQLYTAVLNGHPSGIRIAVRLCLSDLTSGKGLTLRQLLLFRTAYIGLRMRWIESFRMNHKTAASLDAPPGSCFRLPFRDDGQYDLSVMEESLIADLSAISDYLKGVLGMGPASQNLFQQIEQYIHFHYAKHLSLESIAEEFSLSSNYLSRSFKKKTGTGITDYINNVRIQKAKELLENPEIKIFHIAAQVGYSDEKYFSRVFKKTVGMSPLQYRIAHTAILPPLDLI